MNKDLINSLIKVANNLDNIGLVKEASVVDRVAYELENFKKEVMIQKGFTKIPSS